MSRSENGHRERLAVPLGWFSTGLGLAQLTVPGRLNRLVGLDDTGGHRALMRAVGVRELASGGGILVRPRPVAGLWARVAGDAMDLSMLGAALHANTKHQRRVALAMGSVIAVTVADLVASVRTSRRGANGVDAVRAVATTTINRPVEEVYRAWRDVESLPVFMDHLGSVEATSDRRSHWVAHGPAGTTVEWDAEIVEDVVNELVAWRSVEGADVDNAGSVRFAPAAKGHGTEVTVELDYVVPGGAAGAVVAKVLGEEPSQQIKDDLRRFKQVLETGEVVRSDGSPAGTRSMGQVHQHPARPAA